MVKLSRGRPGSAIKKSPGSAGKKVPGQQQQPPVKPLNTSKGQFTFTMVTDGCYIEHKVAPLASRPSHTYTCTCAHADVTCRRGVPRTRFGKPSHALRLVLSQWGQNSGHVGVPLEAIPGFIQRLQALYSKKTGQPASAKSPVGKSPGAKSPGGGPKGIGKGKKTKVVKVTKKEKPKKMTTEELDNDLMNYTAARVDTAEMPAEGVA